MRAESPLHRAAMPCAIFGGRALWSSIGLGWDACRPGYGGGAERSEGRIGSPGERVSASLSTARGVAVLATAHAPRTRRSFARLNKVLEVPNLIAIQRKSFEWRTDPKTGGLRETIDDI